MDSNDLIEAEFVGFLGASMRIQVFFCLVWFKRVIVWPILRGFLESL